MDTKIEKKDGMIEVKADYNAEFVREIKYIPGRKWDAELKVWTVPDTNENEAEVRRLVEKYFKDLETKVIKIEGEAAEKAPQIDGVRFFVFARDWASVKDRDNGIKIEILKENIKSGGSRAHPLWHGCAILRITARKGFQIEHDANTTVTVLLEGEDANSVRKIREVLEKEVSGSETLDKGE